MYVSLCSFIAQHLLLVCHLTQNSLNLYILPQKAFMSIPLLVFPYYLSSCSFFATLTPLPFLNILPHDFLQALVLAFLIAELEHPSSNYPHGYLLIAFRSLHTEIRERIFTLLERPFLTTSHFLTLCTPYLILPHFTHYLLFT